MTATSLFQWEVFAVLLAAILGLSAWAWRQETKAVRSSSPHLEKPVEEDASPPADTSSDLSAIRVGSPEFYRLSKRQRRRLRREQAR